MRHVAAHVVGPMMAIVALAACSDGGIGDVADAGTAAQDAGAPVMDAGGGTTDAGADAAVPADVGDHDAGGADDTGTPDAGGQLPDSGWDAGLVPGKLTAVWANDGADKVTRDELRAGNGDDVKSSVWDGTTVKLFGAKNEVVQFNVVLESKDQTTSAVSVKFDSLTGPGGAKLLSGSADKDTLYDWRGRNIELFYVRYLQIKGLSALSYEHYDERQIPKRLRRPWSGDGIGTGDWADRPDHDKYYPDIAVPLEVVPQFSVAAGQNQSIWADIYIPKDAAPGKYSGFVTVSENGSPTKLVPVELTVRPFALPDEPSSKTMVVIGYRNLNTRYLGVAYPDDGTPEDLASRAILKRHFLMAHRHRLALIGDFADTNQDKPHPDWTGILDGTLFTGSNGYDGPGVGTGNGVYSIGTYSSWGWKSGGEAGMRSHSDGWVNWFSAHAPGAEYFLYLIDESNDYPQIEQWSQWIKNNPGPGKSLAPFATIPLPNAAQSTPSLAIAASWITVGITAEWDDALSQWKGSQGRKFYCYNGKRPSNGSFSTEDDGVALRELPWAAFKRGVDRWFFWESTYYNDFQGGRGETDVFNNAHTFGGPPTTDPVLGETSWNHSNGDGLLFYPGTDTFFPQSSYGVNGPFSSLRMKHWRRGLQDADYLTLAKAKDAAKVKAIVDRMVPKALWEYGVNDVNDPTWVRADISWSTNPDDWEQARAELAEIIEGPQRRAPTGPCR